MKNIVLYDWPVDDSTQFTQEIANETGEEWHSLGMQKENNRVKKIYNSFRLVVKVFLERKQYEKIVCWQQLHGLLFATLCRLLHVEKSNELTIMTLIYKSKKGVVGKVWYKFFKFALSSKYVDRIICFSQNESDYYAAIFGIDSRKFKWTTYGVEDCSQEYEITSESPYCSDGGYLLAAGRSNRDHGFLIDALRNSPYKAIIVDRTSRYASTENCEILKNINYGKQLYELIAKAYAIVVPLDNVHISAGQTVFIQAMMFGKPLIVTQTETLESYVQNNKNGFIIKKNKQDLIKVVAKLVNEEDVYNTMSQNARMCYLENFTYGALGKNIGKILKN